MKYSFIISYRDRQRHLETLLPRLAELMEGQDYEIIIAEQDNNEAFQKNSLYNIAALQASGDTLIFHDVDYYPDMNISYDTDEDVPFYPVGKVIFLNENNIIRDANDVPSGYSNFHNTVGDHSGGVFVLSKKLFEKINGFNPFFRGWGKEDDATRDRLRVLGYQWKRNDEGLFYALYHEDSKPADNDPDFINNHKIYFNLRSNLELGYKNVSADVNEYNMDGFNNVRWLKINNFKYVS